MEEIDPEEELETNTALTNPRLALSNGDWIKDRYQLIQPLGEGVLGATWRARDAAGGSDVAVKLVGGMLLLNEGERRDFASKLEMFARRTLAGCVMPLEVVPAAGCVAVVTPFVDAVSLRAVLTARAEVSQPFTVEEGLRVLLSLVGALQAMHTASPHGMLRPANVMISNRGLLLTDGILGVCLPPDRLYERVRLSAPRLVPYVAPEVAAGRRPTASADLYALGAVAAELVGGATPDRGPNLLGISRDLHRAVATLLDREPGRRPAGVRMLLDALTQAAGFPERPPEPPLPVPESVGAVWAGAIPVFPSPLPAAGRPAVPPTVAPGDFSLPTPPPVIRLEPAVPDPETRVAAPPAPDPATRVAGAPGRLGNATASLPLPGSAPLQSGPPPDLAVRSGPPQSIGPSGPPRPGSPSRYPPARGPERPRPSASPSRPAPAPSRPPERSMNDDDGIDPRLLRAARLLDAERRKDWPDPPTEEIELVEEG